MGPYRPSKILSQGGIGLNLIDWAGMFAAILRSLFCVLLAGSGETGLAQSVPTIYVNPSESIQAAVNAAAKRPKPIRVVVKAGTYRPRQPEFALVSLNRSHDGIQLVAEGEVVLTAENKAIADPQAYSYPAVVSHVLYLGDGLTDKTTISGFTITGANGFLSRVNQELAEPNAKIPKTYVFHADGGGIKVFGNSYPILDSLTVKHNRVLYCGAGISIEQRGLADRPVLIKNSTFENNSNLLTGAAIDALPGSKVIVDKVVVKGNRANHYFVSLEKAKAIQRDFIGKEKFARVEKRVDFDRFRGSAAIAAFGGTRISISNSTIVENNSGIQYSDYVDWYRWEEDGFVLDAGAIQLVNNTLKNNWRDSPRNRAYDLDLAIAPAKLSNNSTNGEVRLPGKPRASSSAL